MSQREKEQSSDLPDPTEASLITRDSQDMSSPLLAIAPSKERMAALDVYRGLTMVGMILVDNMGPVGPWWLDHAKWDGLTPADLIFPAFLFIMGMAVPLSVSQKRPIRLKNVLRVALLFGIGIGLNIYSRKGDFDNLRIMGILQRLALSYGIVLLLHRLTGYGAPKKRIFGLVFVVLAALLYFFSMIFFTYDECPNSPNLQEYCNLSGYIDRQVLTVAHIWLHKFNDPEGIYSTINAFTTTYAGYCFMLLAKGAKIPAWNTLRLWVCISIICGATVYPLTLVMPLNKQIYSTSFLMAVIGVCGVVVSFLIVAIDILPKKHVAYGKVIKIVTSPLKWLGMNPLVVFVLMSLVANTMLKYIHLDDGRNLWSAFYSSCFQSWIDDQEVAATLFAGFFLLLYTILAGLLFKFNIFIRV